MLERMETSEIGNGEENTKLSLLISEYRKNCRQLWDYIAVSIKNEKNGNEIGMEIITLDLFSTVLELDGLVSKVFGNELDRKKLNDIFSIKKCILKLFELNFVFSKEPLETNCDSKPLENILEICRHSNDYKSDEILKDSPIITQMEKCLQINQEISFLLPYDEGLKKEMENYLINYYFFKIISFLKLISDKKPTAEIRNSINDILQNDVPKMINAYNDLEKKVVKVSSISDSHLDFFSQMISEELSMIQKTTNLLLEKCNC